MAGFFVLFLLILLLILPFSGLSEYRKKEKRVEHFLDEVAKRLSGKREGWIVSVTKDIRAIQISYAEGTTSGRTRMFMLPAVLKFQVTSPLPFDTEKKIASLRENLDNFPRLKAAELETSSRTAIVRVVPRELNVDFTTGLLEEIILALKRTEESSSSP